MNKLITYTSGASVARQLLQSKNKSWNWNLRFVPICSSTEINLTEWLREKPLIQNQPRAVFARRQNRGKGQYGRIWESQNGGVWLSAAIGCELTDYSSSLFGLAVAVSLSERLNVFGLPVKIKWPNDLMFKDKKIAGILPRLVYRGNELRVARVGVGLNVYNRVPKEGISISSISTNHKFFTDFWTSEVLLSIQKASNSFNANYICKEVEKRLWSRKFFDKSHGKEWEIKCIEKDGSIRVSNGNQIRVFKC